MPYKDPEKRKEKQKEYYLKNKEKTKEKGKEYYLKNKEYYQSPIGKKKHTISRWKYKGLIADNIDELYERYKNSTNCELCGHDYSFSKKCLDHDHNTGLFRNVVCHKCNVQPNLRVINKNNTSGYKNITISNSGYRVELFINKIRYRKTFKTLEEAITYRDSLISCSKII